MTLTSKDIQSGDFAKLSVAQPTSVHTPINHFEVNDIASKAQAHARITVSGSVAREGAGNILLAMAHAKLDAGSVVEVAFKGIPELTNDSEP